MAGVAPELVVSLPLPLEQSQMTLTCTSSRAGVEEPLASPCWSLAPRSLSLRVAVCKTVSIVCKGSFTHLAGVLLEVLLGCH